MTFTNNVLSWLNSSSSRRQTTMWGKLNLDKYLFAGLVILSATGLFILYSASNQDLSVIEQQVIKIILAFGVMILMAQIPPDKYRHWSPWLFVFSLILLVAVLIVGHIGKGAQRWLSIGFIKFQPSEVMKIALPMMLAWFFHGKQLPPKLYHILFAGILIGVPMLLTAKQPDLGTAMLIGAAGFSVIILAGFSWRILLLILVLVIAASPVAWHFMHDYQRQRVLTFLNPERDPLGTGYHIIQSKIAIGSGGIYGKGWLHGTQSHLDFLPEHATDFIFAVSGEELGLIGGIALILMFTLITARCFYIASQAQDTYTRLLAGGLAFSFFISMFINIGMVTGILPVVGVPLPLVSYGGTSIVTLLASFGILMSIHGHRKLVAT